ncbi:MAG: hypothetical protein AB7I33_04595 [Gemmatimonadales bacterium]
MVAVPLAAGRVAVLSWCLLPLLPGTSPAQVDQDRAAAYFREAADLCRRAGDGLWGVSLCGPMVFADVTTGTIATNQPAPEAPRPRVLGYANTALKWGEERWSTFVWRMIPVEDTLARDRMMMHELFHRVQPGLGLYVAATSGENDHLDTAEGRYWMRLEWRALARALTAEGAGHTTAVQDALAFRVRRRALSPDAAERERISEINEGLAQYTGTVVAAGSRERAVADVVDQLARAEETPSYVRTFAYASGAAYGLLLDVWSPGWTRRITASDDLGQLTMAAAGMAPSADPDAAALRYDGRALWAAEQQRDSVRRARIAELRRRFVEGPVLVLPRGRNASFITLGLTPLPGEGTIYPQYRVSGPWGRIEAEMVLVSLDGNSLRVPLPYTVDGSSLSGEGWQVSVAAGWAVRPGPRAGDFQVVEQAP